MMILWASDGTLLRPVGKGMTQYPLLGGIRGMEGVLLHSIFRCVVH